MVYQRVSKPSSENSQIHKKDSASTAPAIPIQAKSDSASPQEQEMPSYTPLAANWATNNNLMRSMSGAQVVQRQEESGEEEMEPIQAKLTIGQVGDKYEQEADQTAQRVVDQINAPAPQPSSQSQTLQRREINQPRETTQAQGDMVQAFGRGGVVMGQAPLLGLPDVAINPQQKQKILADSLSLIGSELLEHDSLILNNMR
ncbi:MAG TPA: hypothetical protein V6D26_31645 [Stenomitos sp.]